MRALWTAVAVCIAALIAAVPPEPLLAGPPSLVLDLSFNIGPIAAEVHITNPVAQPGGMFSSTLHVHARDDTQTPALNADLVATGQAADANTLLGGFLPAALIILKDMAAGMSFQQAAGDAQAKTGVTVTFLNDTAIEYAVLLALIEVVVIHFVPLVSPPLRDQLCAINDILITGLKAGGFPTSPPDACATPTPTPIP